MNRRKLLKTQTNKWQKLGNSKVYYGDKYIYVYNDQISPRILFETIQAPPTHSIRMAICVKDFPTTQKIVKLLEK